MSKERMAIVILGVLLVLSVGYIVFDSVQKQRNQEMVTVYRQGYNQGLTDAVVTLYRQTENCNAAVINIGNVTRQVVDTGCLRKE